MAGQRKWWHDKQWWITTVLAGIALMYSGIDIHLTHWRRTDLLRLSPIQADRSESEFLIVDLALSNTGSKTTVLAELCAVPRPWKEELRSLPDTYLGRYRA